MNATEEKINSLFAELAQWHGMNTADLVSTANNRGDSELDEPDLWDADPDLALLAADLIDVESLLAIGGCLDGNH